LLEPDRQPVSIGTILIPSWQLDHLPRRSLSGRVRETGRYGFEQPLEDVDAVIGVDPDQVSIEGRMMDFGSGRRSMVPNRQRNRSPAP
jgi:hypothetical protein